jgi:hypothetical protein
MSSAGQESFDRPLFLSFAYTIWLQEEVAYNVGQQ